MGVYQGRKSHNSGRCQGRRGRTGFYRIAVREAFYDEENQVFFTWVPRGKILTTAKLVGDWDYFDDRARHSTGWKEHKYRRQWEHNVNKRKNKHLSDV